MARIISNSDKLHAALKKLKNEANAKELELIELVSSIYESVQEKKDEVIEKVKDTKTMVDTSVHLYPWRYIGGTALVAFILGRFLHRR